MAELHLSGYICKNLDNIIALVNSKENSCVITSIVSSIENFAYAHGVVTNHYTGFGGKLAIINNCNIRVWFTDTKCELEEAMLSLDNLMYGGDMYTRVSRVGYSEYTITGLNLDEFFIGGHNLEEEFSSHCGDYCHVIIEC